MNPLVNSTRITKNRKALRKQNLSIINNLAANQHNCENVANYRSIKTILRRCLRILGIFTR